MVNIIIWLLAVMLVTVIINNLQQKKVIKELKKKSIYDSLTGIFNRGYLDIELLKIIKEVRRNFIDARRRKAKPFSFIMIDIDNFKKVNDDWGHPIGDAFLRSIANALRAIIHRAGDILTRYGGEEFSVILSETDQENALVIAEKMKNAARNIKVRTKAGLKSITISLGVVTIIDFDGCKDITAEEIVVAIINKADSLLYKAKGNGRNRIISIETTLKEILAELPA